VGSGIGARAYNSTTQSVTSGTAPVLTMDSEEFDTEGFHDLATNTSRHTVPAGMGGKYIVSGGTFFASSGAGTYRIIAIFKNGAAVAPHMRRGVAPTDPSLALSVILDLAAGDYVELVCYQDSGGALNVGHASVTEFKTSLSLLRIDSKAAGDAFHGARASLSGGDQNITDGTWTGITLATEQYDTDGYHSTSSNTGRMTATGTGYFKAHAIAGWRVNTTGDRLIQIYKNGSGYSQYAGQGMAGTTLDGDGPAVSDIIPVVPGDYIEVYVYQSSGGTRAVSGARLAVEFTPG
jgi:hypothetical protein